jgi:hypothetical protein
VKSIKAISFYLAAYLAGGASVTAVVSAASGDALYKAPKVTQECSAVAANCVATCLVDEGVWTGAKPDMIEGGAMRASVPSGFECYVSGWKTAKLEDVPIGAEVHGVVVVE